MDDFTHLGFFDVDEFIIPRGKSVLWKDMLHQIESSPSAERFSSYAFSEGCFDAKKDCHNSSVVVDGITFSSKSNCTARLKKIRYTDNFAIYVKSIIKPQLVTAMHVHMPQSMVPNYKRSMRIDNGLGVKHHYRSPCRYVERYSKAQQERVEDKSVEKYSRELSKNMASVIQQVTHEDPVEYRTYALKFVKRLSKIFTQ